MRNQSMREFRVNWYRVFSRWVGLVLAVDRLAGPLSPPHCSSCFCWNGKRRWGPIRYNDDGGISHAYWLSSSPVV